MNDETGQTPALADVKRTVLASLNERIRSLGLKRIDIARAAGCHARTVTRNLAGKNTSERVIDKIRAAVDAEEARRSA